MTTFYCKESPDLKLGPGVDPAEWVTFKDGFAEVSPDDTEKLGWIAAERNFHIENLGEDSTQVPDGTGFACEVCGKSFATEGSRRGHLLSHRPKKAK